jgi:hypothetical protein
MALRCLLLAAVVASAVVAAADTPSTSCDACHAAVGRAWRDGEARRAACVKQASRRRAAAVRAYAAEDDAENVPRMAEEDFRKCSGGDVAFAAVADAVQQSCAGVAGAAGAACRAWLRRTADPVARSIYTNLENGETAAAVLAPTRKHMCTDACA